MPSPFDLYNKDKMAQYNPFNIVPYDPGPVMRDAGKRMLIDKMRQALGLPDYVGPHEQYNDQPTDQQNLRDRQKGNYDYQDFKDLERQFNNPQGFPAPPDWAPGQPPEKLKINAKPSKGKNQTASLEFSAKLKLSPADRIRNIESGSPKGNYTAIGPKTSSGDHAYGAYGVMGSNVGPWTKQYYGKALTPEEFLKNNEAQDAVFQGKFVNEYLPKYGPDGAAKAWFAGEKGKDNPNAKDVLGTTVEQYAKKYGVDTKNVGTPSKALTDLVNADPNFWHNVISHHIGASTDQGTVHGLVNRLTSDKSGPEGSLTGFMKELRAHKLMQISGILG